jgi:hypothetical protein
VACIFILFDSGGWQNFDMAGKHDFALRLRELINDLPEQDELPDTPELPDLPDLPLAIRLHPNNREHKETKFQQNNNPRCFGNKNMELRCNGQRGLGTV